MSRPEIEGMSEKERGMSDDSTIGAGYAGGHEMTPDDRGDGARVGRRRWMLGAAAAGAGAVAGLAAAAWHKGLLLN
jgi:hypothetical protein